MARYEDPEFAQWIEENNFSEDDLSLICRTATRRMLIWYLIPPFCWPLMLNAWAQRRIIKKRTFSPRHGFLFSLMSLAVFVSFILIVPFIVWLIVRNNGLGSGLRGLVKKGLIGGEQSEYNRQVLKSVKRRSQTVRLLIALGAAMLGLLGLGIPAFYEIATGNFGAVGIFDNRGDFLEAGGVIGVISLLCVLTLCVFLAVLLIVWIVCKPIDNRRYFSALSANAAPAPASALNKIAKALAWVLVIVTVLGTILFYVRAGADPTVCDPETSSPQGDTDVSSETSPSSPSRPEDPSEPVSDEPSTTPTTAPTTIPPVTDGVTKYVVAEGGLRIRSIPSTDGDKLGNIPNGTQVTVVPDGSGWAKVTYNGVTGWVSADYLYDAPAPVTSQPDDVVQPTELYDEGFHCTVHAEGGLSMRKGPDASYDRILVIPDGTALVEYAFADGWIFTEYQGRSGWASSQYLEFEGGKAKPVIYLYPETETDVSVRLHLRDGQLSCTYPAYRNGWDVTARPDGTLTDKADGKEYSYLYWESQDNTVYDFSKGFVVKGGDTAAFLQKALAAMGLTPREYNEFIVYWLPQMQKNPYNLITFQQEAYTSSAVLDISPQPDSMLRVFMAYKPLTEPITVAEPTLPVFDRHGFAVVEWGGTQVR